MLTLPTTTFFNKRIPKQKFYDNLSVTPQIKRLFVDQISALYWRNKISPDTVNISAGEHVSEIEVFELRLNQPELDIRVLQLIDREIPYHILFLLKYEEKCQAWIGYKEPSASNADTFVVSSYYHTDWASEDALDLELKGLDVDAVYDSFLRQIAGERFSNTAGSLKEAVERDMRRQQLIKQIEALKKKVKNEKQFNLQMELNAELKKLKSELAGL